jgi:hypothetical protein
MRGVPGVPGVLSVARLEPASRAAAAGRSIAEPTSNAKSATARAGEHGLAVVAAEIGKVR